MAAQIAAYGRATWGSLDHEEFYTFLKDKCFRPGGSKPWQTLLREAIGKDFSPDAYLKDIKSTTEQLKSLEKS